MLPQRSAYAAVCPASTGEWDSLYVGDDALAAETPVAVLVELGHL